MTKSFKNIFLLEKAREVDIKDSTECIRNAVLEFTVQMWSTSDSVSGNPVLFYVSEHNTHDNFSQICSLSYFPNSIFHLGSRGLPR